MTPSEVTEPGLYRWRWKTATHDGTGECLVEREFGSGRLVLDNRLYLDEVAERWPDAEVTMERVGERP